VVAYGLAHTQHSVGLAGSNAAHLAQAGSSNAGIGNEACVCEWWEGWGAWEGGQIGERVQRSARAGIQLLSGVRCLPAVRQLLALKEQE
jgi:hypothetical protein